MASRPISNRHGESAVATAADHEQVRVRRGVDQHLRREPVHDQGAHPHLAVLNGTGDAVDRLGQRLLRRVAKPVSAIGIVQP
jgi:hypothetical protein